ncbi:hypothetical protein [Paracoccus sp. 22332]|uniref:hypothetical protein n=1 Tax=Paracoccus sp. 22332 TaxID=3453913 RepID=UPI003F83C76B
MKQYSSVGLSEAIYSQDTREKADRYRDALSAFNTVVTASDNLLEMAPFWSAASEVLSARDDFLRSLENQALAT